MLPMNSIIVNIITFACMWIYESYQRFSDSDCFLLFLLTSVLIELLHTYKNMPNQHRILCAICQNSIMYYYFLLILINLVSHSDFKVQRQFK